MKTRSKTLKKIIAFLLVLVYIVTLLPLNTLAEETVGISPLSVDLGSGEIIVYNETEFVNALKNAQYTTIYLGADITLNSRVSIPKRTSLTISGTDPQTGVRYQYEDGYAKTRAHTTQSNVAMYMTSGAHTQKITFKDIDILGYNISGIFTTSGLVSQFAIDIVFDNVKGTANQFVEAYGSTFTIINSELNVAVTSGLSGLSNYAEEVAEASEIFFEGNVKIHHNSNRSPGYALFNFYSPAKGEITVRENANVLLETENAGYGCFHFYTGNRKLTVEKNASFTFVGKDRFNRYDSYGKLSSVTIGEGANVSISAESNNNQGFTPGGLYADSVTVGKGVSLRISLSIPTNAALAAAQLTLNNPKALLIHNTGSGNSVSNAAFSGTGLKSMRYYQTTASYNSGNYYKWFFHETGNFNLSFSNWTGTPSSISTSYTQKSPYDSATSANIKASSIKVVEINGTYSSPPTINPVYTGDTVITGIGISGSKVVVTLPDSSSHTVNVIDGVWELSFSDNNITTSLVKGQIVTASQIESLYGFDNEQSDSVQTTVLGSALSISGKNVSKTYYTRGSIADTPIINLDGNGEKISLVGGSLRYVMLSHTDTYNLSDTNAFEAAYTAAASGNKGTITNTTSAASVNISGSAVRSNCIVWVIAEVSINGRTETCLASISYKNLYQRYTIYTRGYAIDDNGQGYTDSERLLYSYTSLEESGDYGVPFDLDQQTVISNPVSGYDTVNLKINSQYAKHWNEAAYIAGITSTVKTPFVLTLDSSFVNNNGSLADLVNTSEARYSLFMSRNYNMWASVPVVYVNSGKASVTVDGESGETLWAPLDLDVYGNPATKCTSFLKYGGSYVPPSDSNNSPVDYYVSTIQTSGTLANINGDWSKFDPKIQDVSASSKYKVYIMFESGQVKITEIYEADEDGNIGTKTVMLYADGSTGYISTAPAITGYVPVGYDVVHVSNTDYDVVYTEFDSSGLAPDASQNGLIGYTIPEDYLDGETQVTIKYYYKADKNNNGIPDDEEVEILIYWNGYYVGNNVAAQLSSAAKYVRASGVGSYTVTNDSSAAGNSNHKIVITLSSSAYKGTWIFDKQVGGNTELRTITGASAGDTVEIYFDYAFATDGQYPDNLQYVSSSYQYVDSSFSFDTAAAFDAIAPGDSTTYVLKGKSVSVTPAAIDGYVFVGYSTSTDNGNTWTKNITYVSNVTAPTSVTFTTTSYVTRVKLLYAKLADNVTITWEGTTIAGNLVTLHKETYSGYIGERLTVYHTDYNLGDTWKLVKGADQSYVINFGITGEAGHTFEYTENVTKATITIKYVTTDGQIDFTQTVSLLPNDGEQTYSYFPLSGYELISVSVVDAYGNTLSESDTATNAVIDPNNGDQTLTFTYVSRGCNVSVYAVDYDTGEQLSASTFTNAISGNLYAVTAPFVDKYYLVDGEGNASTDVLYTIDSVQEGGSTVTFYYRELTSDYIELYEAVYGEDGGINTAKSTLIGYYPLTEYNDGEEVGAPDLSGSFYKLSGSCDDSQEYVSGNSMSFYYDKEMIDVNITAVDGDGKVIKVFTDKARRGEMYTAKAPRVSWYDLNDDESRTVYVDPVVYEQDVLEITFTYIQNATGQITVNFYYYDSGKVKQYLSSFTGTAVVGSDFSADYIDFSSDGFELAAGEKAMKTIVVSENSDKNVIEFEYKDVWQKITINYYKYDESLKSYVMESALTLTDRAAAEDLYTVNPVNVNGFVLVEYGLDNGSGETKNSVDLSNNNAISVTTGIGNTTVNLYYKLTETVVDKGTVPVNVSGTVDNTAKTELYSYTAAALKNSGDYTITPFTQNGYKLSDVKVNGKNVMDDSGYWNNGVLTVDVAEEEINVEFVYVSLSTYVTVKMVDDSDVEIADSFKVSATTGEAFSYYAPAVDGYYSTNASPIGTIASVEANGGSSLTFTYKKITSAVTLIAKEQGTDTIIGVYEVDTTGFITDGKTSNSCMTPVIKTYTAVNNTVEIVWDGVSSASVTAYYTKNTVEVTVTIVDGDGNVISEETVTAREGETVVIPAPDVPGYVVVDENPKTVIAGEDTIVEFEYRKIVSGELVVKAVDEAGNLIESYSMLLTLTGDAEKDAVTVKAPELLGWALKSGQTTPQTVDPNEVLEVVFVYKADVAKVTVRAVDGDGEPLGTWSYTVARGAGYTAYAPHIDGYVLKAGEDSSKTISSVTGNTEITFRYTAIEEIVDEYTININIVGEDENGMELYTDTKTVAQNSGTCTALAREQYGYAVIDVLVDGVSQGGAAGGKVSVTVAADDIEVKFIYRSLGSKVTIKMLEADTGAELDKLEISAMTGDAFTCLAPDVSGYYLVSDSNIGYVESVAEDGSSTIVFEYKKIESGIIFVAKENDTNGNIIKVVDVDTTSWASGTNTAQVPDLTSSYYTYTGYDQNPGDSSGTVTIDYEPEEASKIIEVYYKKDTVTINVVAKSEDGTVLSTSQETVRKGEAVKISAPSVEGYTLLSAGAVLLVPTNDETVEFHYTVLEYQVDIAAMTVKGYYISSVTGAKIVVFSSTTDEVVAKPITVSAPELDSRYKLSDSETKTVTISKDKENLVEFLFSFDDTDPHNLVFTDKHIKYINGYPDGTVRPDGDLSRAEAATIFYNLLDMPDKDNISNASIYSDVKVGSWYYNAVTYLSQYKVLKGFEGKFRPDDKITRAEFSAIISRLMKLTYNNETNPFSDVKTNHWAYQNITNCYTAGLIDGYPDGTFRPDKNITRAEAVKVINGMLDRRIHLEDIPNGVVQFTDLYTSHWGYTHMVEASVAHEYERQSDGYEIWTKW